MKKCNKCKQEIKDFIWTLTKKSNNQTEYYCNSCFEERKKTCLKEYSQAIQGNSIQGGQGKEHWNTCANTDENGECSQHKGDKQNQGKSTNKQPSNSPTDTNYRYCFECDKWLTKNEVNLVDWGEQPGGHMGQCWYCSYCKKQLGDDSQTQIFRCHKHPHEILKVWGVSDGESKQKVFYTECPQKQEQRPQPQPIPKQPNNQGGVNGGLIAVIIFGVLGLGGMVAYFLLKDKKKAERGDF